MFFPDFQYLYAIPCPNCGLNYNRRESDDCPRCQGIATSNSQNQKSDLPNLVSDSSLEDFETNSTLFKGQSTSTSLNLSSMYLGAIAYFLKALWFVTLSGIFGQWAMSQYSAKMSEISMKLTQCGGGWSYSCSEPSILGIWLVPAIASLVLLILAGISGSDAIARLRQAE